MIVIIYFLLNGVFMRFDSIHNYYETLVVRELIQTFVEDIKDIDEDYIQDIACIALNMLPSRYVRHDVDMAFFLTSEEREEMDNSVKEAVMTAKIHVDKQTEETIRPNTYQNV
jgi:competence protein ComFB